MRNSHSLIFIVFTFILSSGVLHAAFDCDEIQSKIDAISDQELSLQEITVKAGEYICKRPLIINKSNVALKGELDPQSGKSPKIKLARNVNAPVLIIGSPHTKWMTHPETKVTDFYTVEAHGSEKIKIVRNVIVENLEIDGNKEYQWFECWTPDAPKQEEKRPNDVKISEKTCADEGPSAIRNNGLTIRGAENVKISGLITNNNSSGGVVTEKYSKNLHIVGLIAKHNWFDGFAGYQTTNSIIENSFLTENLGAGASLDLGFNYNTFKNVEFSDNAHQGIFARNLKGNKVIDSRIRCNGYQGVFLASAFGMLKPVDTADFRLWARQMGFDIKGIYLPESFFQQLIEKNTESNQIPKDFLINITARFQSDTARALQLFYENTINEKTQVCAINNEFINTEISCSGVVDSAQGEGIRVNDDECIGNSLDKETINKFPASKQAQNTQGPIVIEENAQTAKPNKKSDFSLGTVGELKKEEIPLIDASQKMDRN